MIQVPSLYFFFFNDTATTEIYTLSLHDALPISQRPGEDPAVGHQRPGAGVEADAAGRLRVAAGGGRRRAPVGGAVRRAVRRSRLVAVGDRAEDSHAERSRVGSAP